MTFAKRKKRREKQSEICKFHSNKEREIERRGQDERGFLRETLGRIEWKKRGKREERKKSAGEMNERGAEGGS